MNFESDSVSSTLLYPSLVQLVRHAVVDARFNHKDMTASSPPPASLPLSPSASPSSPSPPSSLSSPLSGSSGVISLVSGPFDTLPPELLIIIFYYCILDNPDSPLVLSRVCSYWRSIFMDVSSLWRRLYLVDTNFDAVRLRAKTDRWFAKAGSQRVDVDLDTRRRDSVLPLLSYILAHQPARWGRVKYHHSRLQFLTAKQQEQLYGEGTNSTLESMLITLSPKKKTPTDLPSALPSPLRSTPSSPMEAPWQGTQSVPSVKDFGVDNGYLRQVVVLGVRCLPHAEQLRAFSMTTLKLVNSSYECDFPMHQVVPFLAAFPNLEELDMSNFNELFIIHDPEYRPDCATLEPALLPRLRRLRIREMFSSRCMLSHLITPSLEYLSLVHINSSNTYDFPLPGEPGDSDDEANDFSRSPWTDHATGMGLRKLFSLSSSSSPPPIRELIMDYADLRTKDFIWLFLNLPYLESFRIVASDLSDNVIRALEVSPRARKTSTSGRAVPPVLPKLRRLAFEKCQKMSGEAVCRMVRSRVQAAAAASASAVVAATRVDGDIDHKNDSGIAGCLVAPLEEFSVLECARVGERHHQVLQAIFPPSCRLVYSPGVEE